MKKIYLLTALVFVITSCSDNQKEYDATGTFEATEVTVAAKSSGELKTFTLNEGENLNANQVVGNIDTYELQQKQDELTAVLQQLDATASSTSSRQLNLKEQLASLSQQISHEQQEQKDSQNWLKMAQFHVNSSMISTIKFRYYKDNTRPLATKYKAITALSKSKLVLFRHKSKA